MATFISLWDSLYGDPKDDPKDHEPISPVGGKDDPKDRTLPPPISGVGGAKDRTLPPKDDPKDGPRSLASSLGDRAIFAEAGRLGGTLRAQRLSPARQREIALKASDAAKKKRRQQRAATTDLLEWRRMGGTVGPRKIGF